MQVLTAGPARRKPERRAQRQAHPLRERVGGPWYIGRGVERRSREAAPRLAGHRRARAGVGSACAADPTHRASRRSISPRRSACTRDHRRRRFAARPRRRLHEQDHLPHHRGVRRRLPDHADDRAGRRQVGGDRPRGAGRPGRPPPAAPRAASPARTDAAVNPLRDPNNILSKRSIYFDFDSFVVARRVQADGRGARAGTSRPIATRA